MERIRDTDTLLPPLPGTLKSWQLLILFKATETFKLNEHANSFFSFLPLVNQRNGMSSPGFMVNHTIKHGGVLHYKSRIGMCRPKGCGFCAVAVCKRL